MLRGLIFILLLLVASGLQWYWKSDSKQVVYVVDHSESVRSLAQAESWIDEAEGSKREQDASGLVSFAMDASIEQVLRTSRLQPNQWSSQMKRSLTHLEKGLQYAESLLPQRAGGRMVLISDGEENAGDVVRQARLLAQKELPVDVLYIPRQDAIDVAVDELRLPESLYQGERFTLQVSLKSTVKTEGVLRVYEDQQEISSQSIEIERGLNRFALDHTALQTGLHRYRAEIYVDNDQVAANNQSSAFSRVEGPPQILVVSEEAENDSNLASLLDSGLLPYKQIRPELMPRVAEAYAAYDSVILNNVPAHHMSLQQMEQLELAVREYGTGLLMVGGENSFGVGGYFDTPIEAALPVYMNLRGKRQIPPMSLVLVMDRSGSMSGDKLSLAKEAAIRTTELMRPQDSIGVLAFDSAPWWIVEPQNVEDKEEIAEKILGLEEGGGTEIYTAVEEGFAQLKETDASRRHMILLTDGQSATQRSYDPLIEQMNEQNITMSTVAIGEGSDRQLLQRLAEQALGRFYYTTDQTTLPTIFSQEAILMSRTYLVEQTFVPVLAQGLDWHDLFQQGAPEIDGYVAVTAKETAEVVLSSPEPDPLLARWQYGAGKAVAWTSDLQGQWTSDWLDWPDFPDIWTELVKWTFPQFRQDPFQLVSERRGEQMNLLLKSEDLDFQGKLKGTLIEEDGSQSTVDFQPSAPGEYTAQIEAMEAGARIMRVDVFEEENLQPAGSWTTGIVVPYSPEYRIQERNGEALLQELAAITGGRELSWEDAEALYQFPVSEHKQLKDLAPFLLLLAMLLWLMDIAIRRLNVAKPISRLFGKTTSDQSKEAATEQEQRLNRLLQAKRRKR